MGQLGCLVTHSIINVGAYEEYWASMARSVWPGASLLMFGRKPLSAKFSTQFVRRCSK